MEDRVDNMKHQLTSLPYSEVFVSYDQHSQQIIVVIKEKEMKIVFRRNELSLI